VRHANVAVAHGAQIMRSVTSAIPDRVGSHSLSTHLVTKPKQKIIKPLQVSRQEVDEESRKSGIFRHALGFLCVLTQMEEAFGGFMTHLISICCS
jgi:hypothetical protein